MRYSSIPAAIGSALTAVAVFIVLFFVCLVFAVLGGCSPSSKTEVTPGKSEVTSDYNNVRPREVFEKTTRIRIVPKEKKHEDVHR